MPSQDIKLVSSNSELWCMHWSCVPASYICRLYLQRHKALLCCALKLLGCTVDAQQHVVGCHIGKDVPFEEPSMQALQPACHVACSVIFSQFAHCCFVLQTVYNSFS